MRQNLRRTLPNCRFYSNATELLPYPAVLPISWAQRMLKIFRRFAVFRLPQTFSTLLQISRQTFADFLQLPQTSADSPHTSADCRILSQTPSDFPQTSLDLRRFFAHFCRLAADIRRFSARIRRLPQTIRKLPQISADFRSLPAHFHSLPQTLRTLTHTYADFPHCRRP